MQSRHPLLVLLALLLCPLAAFAQGLAIHQEIAPVPRRPVRPDYSIKSVSYEATVRDQVADVQLSQVFRNDSSRDLEVEYLFPLPPEAVVSQFTLMVDGKELAAKMYSREEANRIYESIVRSKQDPALLQYVGYGLLKTNVFPLPKGAERKVTLRYSQVCRRDQGVTELAFPMAGGRALNKPIDDFKASVRVEGSGKIKSVYSPSYAIDITRPGDTAAVIKFAATNFTPAEDLRLFWSLSDKPIGATLLSFRPSDKEDGYFLLLASPDVKAPDASVASKTVIFVIDKSGSMAGPKIEQARNALKFVLNNLREGDTFNIVAYDQKVESFKPELQRFDNETRAEALRFVDSIHDGGSTNIDGALRRAMELVGEATRPSYVIFLTDGLPTAGEQNESRIAENAKAANKARARLFSFGVGFDVNARLLDRLSTQNGGASEYVKPNENIETAVAKFYGKMTSPVATGLKLDLAGSEMNRLYPRELPDLFAGGQLVAVGRYRASGDTTIRLSGTIGGKPQTYEFAGKLAAASTDETYGFVEKLWATRRVGEIINELDLRGKNQELIDELVRLATKHGILTQYTAFLADERTELSNFRENGKAASERIFEAKDGLATNSGGAYGVNQRAAKAQLQSNAQVAGGAQAWTDANGRVNYEAGCQVVGNRAMFMRQGRWVDPTVTAEETKAAEVVEQFTDRYFELARTNANLRRYLALPEGCTVRVDGKVYQVNAPQQQNRG